MKFWGWWTGKQYVNHKNIIENPQIISISWKWLDEDVVHFEDWGDDMDDKALLDKFLVYYNDADMVIGQNNNSFDNRWIMARAAFHNLFVNVFVKSFDIMRQAKRLFRLPSYSMDFMTKYFKVNHKDEHEGIIMWKMIQEGTKEQKIEYLEKMKRYNINDIVSTEALYRRLIRYMKNVIHVGVLEGGGKWQCPVCGSANVSIYKSTYTAAGTIQHIMMCNEDSNTYKISHSEYNKYLNEL